MGLNLVLRDGEKFSATEAVEIGTSDGESDNVNKVQSDSGGEQGRMSTGQREPGVPGPESFSSPLRRRRESVSLQRAVLLSAKPEAMAESPFLH